jgi:hypothetical protein
MIISHSKQTRQPLKDRVIQHASGEFQNVDVGTLPKSNVAITAASEKPTILENGVIIHDRNAMTANINKTKVFHADPDVPHIIHDKNLSDKKYKDVVVPVPYTAEIAGETERVFPHASVISPNSYVEKPRIELPVEEPVVVEEVKTVSVEDSLPKTVEALDLYFKDDVVEIIKAIVEKKFNFEIFPIDFTIPKFNIIGGEEGMAKATFNTPFTLRTPNPKAISYLVGKILSISYNMGYDVDRLTQMVIDTVSASSHIEEWLMLMVELWTELKKQRKI